MGQVCMLYSLHSHPDPFTQFMCAFDVILILLLCKYFDNYTALVFINIFYLVLFLQCTVASLL